MTTTTHDEHRSEQSAEPREHRLREVLPAVVSVVMLFGLLMAGALLLKDVAGLGLWLVSAP